MFFFLLFNLKASDMYIETLDGRHFGGYSESVRVICVTSVIDWNGSQEFIGYYQNRLFRYGYDLNGEFFMITFCDYCVIPEADALLDEEPVEYLI